MWRFLNHQFLLPLSGIYTSEPEAVHDIFLVSPFMQNGTLTQWRKNANPSTDEIERLAGFSSFAIHRSSLYARYWKLLKASHTSIQKAQFMVTSAGYFT